MSIPDYTVVVGVDDKHLKQWTYTLPTWKKNKPSLLDRPWIVFYDCFQVKQSEVEKAVGRTEDVVYYPWPPKGVVYERQYEDRFGDPQRYKMLAGFVHVPGEIARTPYWLKLDTDTVAVGKDKWVQSSWFKTLPSIVSHPWSFTKPPDQIDYLDDWVAKNKDDLPLLAKHAPLDLHPLPGSDRVGHKRIISWCAFFNTVVTRLSASMASSVCGPYQLPIPSQDGYLWYVAKRMEHEILRTSMKNQGWQVWHTFKNIKKAAERALYG